MQSLNDLKPGDRVRATENVTIAYRVSGKRWPLRRKMPAGAHGTVTQVYDMQRLQAPWQNQVTVMFDGGGPGTERTVCFTRLLGKPAPVEKLKEAPIATVPAGYHVEQRQGDGDEDEDVQDVRPVAAGLPQVRPL